MVDELKFREDIPFEVKLRALENINSSTVITKKEGRDNPIVYVNSAFQKLTGLSVEEIIGKDCRFLQGDNTEPERVREIRESLEAGNSIETMITNYKWKKNNEGIFVSEEFKNQLSIEPLGDDYFVGVQKDVTKREKLKELRRLSSENNRVLLKSVAHDYRGVVANLAGVVSLYSDRKDLSDDAKEILSMLYLIDDKSKSLLDIVEGVSNFQTSSEFYKKTDAVETIHSSYNFFKSKIKERGMSFEYEGPSSFFIETDPNLYRLITDNLFSNAVKYAGNKTTIKTKLDSNNGAHKLFVFDDGVGISDEEKDLVFKEHKRAKNSSQEEGSGFGLFGVKTAVNSLGGKISLYDNKPSGTVFEVTLPNSYE
ncbi:MAG: ATP-binding protein [Candidatus Woesearchaeota archaeon]